MNTQIKIDEALLNRIIAAAYGDCSLLEKVKIQILAFKNEDVKNLLNEYKKTSAAVKNIKIDKCPDEIINKVSNKIGYKSDNVLISTLRLLNKLYHRPIYAAAITLILFSAAAAFFFINQKGAENLTNKSIDQAEKQVKQSLVFVNRIFEKTAGRVENDILKEQVAKPVHEGISTINNLFKGG